MSQASRRLSVPAMDRIGDAYSTQHLADLEP